MRFKVIYITDDLERNPQCAGDNKKYHHLIDEWVIDEAALLVVSEDGGVWKAREFLSQVSFEQGLISGVPKDGSQNTGGYHPEHRNPFKVYRGGVVQIPQMLHIPHRRGGRTDTIKLKRRSYFGVLLRSPQVFEGHYKLLLKGGASRLEAIRAALLLTLLLVCPNKNPIQRDARSVFPN